jgi:hypothetical protein
MTNETRRWSKYGKRSLSTLSKCWQILSDIFRNDLLCKVQKNDQSGV